MGCPLPFKLTHGVPLGHVLAKVQPHVGQVLPQRLVRPGHDGARQRLGSRRQGGQQLRADGLPATSDWEL
jgi:hypothetical protein